MRIPAGGASLLEDAPGNATEFARTPGGRDGTIAGLVSGVPARGLCQTCRHARDVAGRHSTFVLCTRALVDAAYVKYPVLPVRGCPGYEPAGRAGGRAGEAGGPSG